MQRGACGDRGASCGLRRAGPRRRPCAAGVSETAELATSDHAGDATDDELRDGQLLWATVDSPWIHNVDTAKYLAGVQPLREMAPEAVLSTPLPPAVGIAPR
ncbi:hypothetical protein ACWGH4_29955 [Streptomyces sp. NPDC054847]